MMDDDLQDIAVSIRATVFRTIAKAGGGHFGGSLSVVEILTALYFKVLRIDPHNPTMQERDRFILSKGHSGPALYVTLAYRGFFPREWLAELDTSGGRLPKHVDRFKVPGVDVSSGALGQGLSIGVGMSLAAKLDLSDTRVYVVMGDGECNSGQIWEAAMTAAKYHLDNLTAIVDRNHLQVDGPSDEVMPLEPFPDKWRSFGWNVISADGHSIPALLGAIEAAANAKHIPTVIIAETTKGKGISFMENRYEWHSGSVSPEQLETGLADLKGRFGQGCIKW